MAANFARVRHEAPAGRRGEAIYQVARVFRQDELGPLHNPEFTLVEWYRAGDDMDEGMQLTSDLCEAMLGRGKGDSPHLCEAPVGPCRQMVTVPFFHPARPSGSAIARRSSVMWASIRIGPTADNWPRRPERCGIEPPASLGLDDRDGWLDLLMVERIQPHLGLERPALLYDYPASQAALARIRPGDPPVAERFELYVAGIELANGYHELLDPAELRARNAAGQRPADGRREAGVARGKPAAGGDGGRACRRRWAWRWVSTGW